MTDIVLYVHNSLQALHQGTTTIVVYSEEEEWINIQLQENAALIVG